MKFLPLALGLASCTSTHVMVGEARQPVPYESVRVYKTPPPNFTEIAMLNATGAWGKPGFQGSLSTAVGRLKAQAADLGANGVILDPVAENALRPATPVSGTAIFVP
jgi:hypothetical protein